jgi:PAS domain S-box-containing protein
MGLFSKFFRNRFDTDDVIENIGEMHPMVDSDTRDQEVDIADLTPASGKHDASLEPAPSPFFDQASILLGALIENLPDAVFFKDCKSRFILINKTLAERVYLLNDPAQAVGRTDFDFFAEEHARKFYENEQEILRTGKPLIGLEEKEPMPDGRVMWFLTSKFPLWDQNRNIIGTWGVSRDITAQRCTEEELKSSEEKLRHSQKMEAFGQLAGGIAHDFNNMLGVILGSAQLMEIQVGDDKPEIKRNITRVIESSKRAADLTQQLLAFARKGNYKIVSLDINEVIRSVIGLLRHTIDKKVRIEERLGASPATIKGDYMLLQNALLNLALNARDAMPDGGTLTFATEIVGPDAALGAVHGDSRLRLVVSDTGCGMDEETKRRAFEPFFTTKGPGKGTGLGLASVYGTIKSHNGLIELKSDLKKGTSFSIFLPLDITAEPRPVEDRRETKKGSGTILVIDDEENVQCMLKEMLESLGYIAIVRQDGISGIEYYKDHHAKIDAIIVDMVMPRMGGNDCIKFLKQLNPKARILISSGYSLVSDTQQILSNGIAGYIQKPFEINELSQALYQALKLES